MPRTEDYQANWRGARRYQFDEEYRRKAAALNARTEAPACNNDQPEIEPSGPWTQSAEMVDDPVSPVPLGTQPPRVRSRTNVWWLAGALAAISFTAVFAGSALMSRLMTLLK